MQPQSRFGSDVIRLPGWVCLCLLSTSGVSAHCSTSQHAGIWEKGFVPSGPPAAALVSLFLLPTSLDGRHSDMGRFPPSFSLSLSLSLSLALALAVSLKACCCHWSSPLCLGSRSSMRAVWFKTWGLNAWTRLPPPAPPPLLYFLLCWCHSAGLFNSSIP